MHKYIVCIYIYDYFLSYAEKSGYTVVCSFCRLTMMITQRLHKGNLYTNFKLKILSSTLTKVCPIKSWEYYGPIVDM